jgi:Chromate transporter
MRSTTACCCPGPEAQQLATYMGWLMHRTRGGIMAGGLFILPGIVALMTLSVIYATWGKFGYVAAAFFGLKAAVLAIVVEAIVRIGRRSQFDAWSSIFKHRNEITMPFRKHECVWNQGDGTQAGGAGFATHGLHSRYGEIVMTSNVLKYPVLLIALIAPAATCPAAEGIGSFTGTSTPEVITPPTTAAPQTPAYPSPQTGPTYGAFIGQHGLRGARHMRGAAGRSSHH